MFFLEHYCLHSKSENNFTKPGYLSMSLMFRMSAISRAHNFLATRFSFHWSYAIHPRSREAIMLFCVLCVLIYRGYVFCCFLFAVAIVSKSLNLLVIFCKKE